MRYEPVAYPPHVLQVSFQFLGEHLFLTDNPSHQEESDSDAGKKSIDRSEQQRRSHQHEGRPQEHRMTYEAVHSGGNYRLLPFLLYAHQWRQERVVHVRPEEEVG